MSESTVDFVRQVPLWVRGWVVAREGKDFRVWPQEQSGYNTLQARSEPGHRTYVWPEQEWMPPEEQARYEKLGAHLTWTDVMSGMARATAPAPQRAPLTPEDMAALMADV